MRSLLLVGLFLVVSGCTTVPDSVRLPEEVNAITYQEVASDPDKSKGRIARWGGVVANIENQKEATLLEVVYFPLRGYGRPIPHDESIGRFRVYVKGFLDPMVYQTGRLMTFVGDVAGAEEGMVGEHNYVYPTIHASGYHLWKDYDRVEVETISVWPSFHFRSGFYGPRGWLGWYGWPYQQRVIIKRRHDHHNTRHHSSSPAQPNTRNVESGNNRNETVRKKEGRIEP